MIDPKKWGQFRQWAVSQGIDPTELDRFYAGKVETEAVKKGLTKVGDIPAGQRTGVLESLLREGFQPETKESAQVIKRRTALQQVIPVLSQLKESVTQSSGGWKGWMESTLGSLIPGYEGKADEAIKRQSEGYARLIANALATEVGVATDKDVNRWLGLMPRAKDSRNEQVEYLNKLIAQVANESLQYGIDTTQMLAPLAALPEEGRAPTASAGVPTAAQTGATPTAAGMAAGMKESPKPPAWLSSLAGFQEYLGRSQALPLAYGTIGGVLGTTVGHPHIGGAVGTAGGERLKQLMAGGKVGDIGAQAGAVAKGLVSGAGTRATQFGLENVLGPLVGRVARKPLQGLLQKVGGQATSPTSGAIEAVGKEGARLATATQPGAVSEGKRLLSWLTQQGERIPTLASKQELTPAYSELGRQGKGLYDYLSKQLVQQAPMTKPINALLSAGYKQILPDWLKRLGWGGAAAGTYQAGRSLISR